MKAFAYALMVAALLASPALADSNGMFGAVLNSETVVLGGPFDHGAATGSADNSSTTGVFTGGFNATEFTIEGDITGVLDFNGSFFYGEDDIVVTDPGGGTIIWQNPAGTVADDGAGSVTSYSATTEFAAPVAAGGTWGFEFIDTISDGAGADSISNNVSVTLAEVEDDTDTNGVFTLATLNAFGDSDTSEGEFLVGGVFDTYTFSTTTAGAIVVETFFQDVLEGTTVDTEIGLFDASGTLIAYDDDDGAGLYSLLGGPGGPIRGPGTYTVAVSGFGSNLAADQVGLLQLADVTGGTSIGDYGISVVLAVPEPAAASLLAIAGLVGFTRRRRS